MSTVSLSSMRMRRFLPALRIAAVSATFACTSATGPQESDLAIAKQRWLLSGVRAYDYTIYRSCECPPEWSQGITISVSNGVVTRRTNATTGAPASESATGFTTIDALFDIVATAIAQHADLVSAAYDPSTGVPLHIAIDGSFKTADDEYELTVANFRAR